jgi:hypothetical protein
MQAGRLLDQIRGMDMDVETEELIRSYLEVGYSAWGLSFGGSVGHFVPRSKCFSLAYPCIDGSVSLTEDWVRHIAYRGFGDIVDLPVELDNSLPPGRFGYEDWTSGMTELLSLGVKMEWVSAEPLYEKVILGESSVDRYINHIRTKPMGLYRFSIAGDYPAWFEHMYISCVA